MTCLKKEVDEETYKLFYKSNLKVILQKYYRHQLFNFNPFVSNALFLYPLKIPKNRKVFWRFQEVEKWCTGIKWVDMILTWRNPINIDTQSNSEVYSNPVKYLRWLFCENKRLCWTVIIIFPKMLYLHVSLGSEYACELTYHVNH